MTITAPELARRVGVDPKRFRAWLRRQAAAGHPLLAGHRHNESWVFTSDEARQLEADFRSKRAARVPASKPSGTVSPRPPVTTPHESPSSRAGHRVVEDWMGEQVETLADLIRPGLIAVCVGINPSPVSVAAGHYYQGQVGQRFFGRLRGAGILPDRHDGFEDDAAFANGIGFTDIIKRPTARAKGLPVAEYDHGRDLLRRKLERYRPGLVIFTFKKTAEVVCGRFAGNGFVAGLAVDGVEAFVMPGPYESASTVTSRMGALAARFA